MWWLILATGWSLGRCDGSVLRCKSSFSRCGGSFLRFSGSFLRCVGSFLSCYSSLRKCDGSLERCDGSLGIRHGSFLRGGGSWFCYFSPLKPVLEAPLFLSWLSWLIKEIRSGSLSGCDGSFWRCGCSF